MSSDKDYMRQYMLRRYHHRRAEAIELLGGCCVQCGSTDDLEFDHINATDKTFDIAKRIGSAPWGVLLAELTKCQLLCHPHHLEKSHRDGDIARGGGSNRIKNPQHGTCITYNKEKCRCEPCRTWKRNYRNGLVTAQGAPLGA